MVWSNLHELKLCILLVSDTGWELPYTLDYIIAHLHNHVTFQVKNGSYYFMFNENWVFTFLIQEL